MSAVGKNNLRPVARRIGPLAAALMLALTIGGAEAGLAQSAIGPGSSGIPAGETRTALPAAAPPAANVPIDNPAAIPDLSKLAPPVTDSRGLSATLQLLVLLTVLTLAPALLVMVTCFTRIVVVLALLRQALATQQVPPNQVVIGLALFMTLFVMTPTWQAVHRDALTPYLAGQMDQTVALQRAAVPVRAFMIRQIEAAGNEADVQMFLDYRGQAGAKEWADVPTTVLIPAFMISELKVSFIMGFRIYLPFLIVDLVISSVLISMGMMMLPPVLISLPFKLLLFVLVDGWRLVVGTLLNSFGGG